MILKCGIGGLGYAVLLYAMGRRRSLWAIVLESPFLVADTLCTPI